MYFDSHAHYNHVKFKYDRYKAIENAFNSGISYILNVSYNEVSVEQALSLSKRYSNVFASVGIHPHYTKDITEESFKKIEKYAEYKEVVAIGETGLDFYRNLSDKETQRYWFDRHIVLAAKFNLPLIVHMRDSYREVADMLEDNKDEVCGVIHSFNGDYDMAKKFLDMGFYISFNGQITYNKFSSLLDVIRNIPMDRVLIESDCPYLTPEPFRGKRNDSSYIKITAETIANSLFMNSSEFVETTTSNAKRLFNVD